MIEPPPGLTLGPVTDVEVPEDEEEEIEERRRWNVLRWTGAWPKKQEFMQDNEVENGDMEGNENYIGEGAWALLEWACDPQSTMARWFLESNNVAYRLCKQYIDLSLMSSARKVMKLAYVEAERGHRVVARASLPCTSWCRWQVLNIRSPSTADRIMESRRMSLKMVRVW